LKGVDAVRAASEEVLDYPPGLVERYDEASRVARHLRNCTIPPAHGPGAD
jgi:hypothetical protein